MAINFGEEMRDLLNNALAEGFPCFLGTASKDGVPQISMKGSVAVFDDDTLCYWERAKRSALENVGENPNVVIFYRNPGKRINWRIQGIAAIHESGEKRDRALSLTPQAELDRDPDLAGVAVLVKVDKITELSGNVLQER